MSDSVRRSTGFRPWNELDLQCHFEGTAKHEFETAIDPVELVTFADSWISAELGVVPAQTAARLAERGFDQAPVAVPDSDLGWSLVSLKCLQDLVEKGLPLAEEHLESEGCAIFYEDVPAPWREDVSAPWRLETILAGLSTRAAAFVCHRYENPRTTEEVEAEKLRPRWLPEPGPCYLWPGAERGHIIGLLTLADLNRRAVRAVLYQLFFALEEALSGILRREHLDVSEWISMLNKDAQAHVLGWWEVSRRDGLDIGPMAGMTLTHLLQIVQKSQPIRVKLGYASGKQAHESLGSLVDIRNRVMHPVRPLVLSESDVTSILRAVMESQRILHGSWSLSA